MADSGSYFSTLGRVRVDANTALPGRDEPILKTFPAHAIFDIPLDACPESCDVAYVAMGCYWGAWKVFLNIDGVKNTAVGFMGGFTKNPTYVESCTGLTGHTETVRIVFDPSQVRYDQLLVAFWEQHDPTQLDRQGGDIGTQYRSALFRTSSKQRAIAEESKQRYQTALTAAGLPTIATTIDDACEFYYAHADHQQYLHKNPNGYQCHQRTGVACPRP